MAEEDPSRAAAPRGRQKWVRRENNSGAVQGFNNAFVRGECCRAIASCFDDCAYRVSSGVRRLCRTECCEMMAYERNADASSMASDGMYWRSVFGGARVVCFGRLRTPPSAFLLLRAVLFGGTGYVFVRQVQLHPRGYQIIYFEHWVAIIQLAYFGLATMLTAVATCTVGGMSRTTPFVVRITELCHGIVLPAAAVNFLVHFCVSYAHRTHCAPAFDHASTQAEWAILAGAQLAAALLDATFSRQPYYSSYSAVRGVLFCWGYLAFTAVYEACGGTNEWGTTYVYRCLDWSHPIVDGGSNAAGKLLMLNFFVAVPLVNYLYWLAIWARRRTLASSKALAAHEGASGAADGGMGGGAPAASPLLPTATSMGGGGGGGGSFFEYGADYRDLQLDGRHWRAQFGGSSAPERPKMGAYMCFGAFGYACCRLLLAVASSALFALRFAEFQVQYADGGGMLLYLGNWVLLLSASYFALAFGLTAYAGVWASAGEATGAPPLVWLTWALYGALLPSSITALLLYGFVTKGDDPDVFTASGFDASDFIDKFAVFGTLGFVLFDGTINRQPYYAAFHGFVGVAVCWGYLAFVITFTALGGTSAAGVGYIYRELQLPSPFDLDAFLTPGKLVFVETLVLVPAFNALYWCVVWARRRARVTAKAAS